MAGNLFVGALGAGLPHSAAERQPVNPIVLEHPRDRRIRYLDTVIASRTPADLLSTEVLLTPKVENLLFYIDWCPIGMPFRDRWTVH